MGEFLVHDRLDCWILLQSCRNTLLWHTVDQPVRSAQNETLSWLAGMNCVKIRTHCKAKHLMAQNDEGRIYILEVELKMDAIQTVKEWKCWVFTTQLSPKKLFSEKLLSYIWSPGLLSSWNFPRAISCKNFAPE